MTFESTGSFDHTESFLKKVSKLNFLSLLNSYAEEGVTALERATPVDTRLASLSWAFEVSESGGSYTISWTNTNVENGFPVVIMLQYGHGTRGGGYVQGRDFINPAMKPVFDDIADKVWKAVTSA
jgi:hypothetical protein